MCKSNKKREDG